MYRTVTYPDGLVRGRQAFPKGPKLLAVLELEDFKGKMECRARWVRT